MERNREVEDGMGFAGLVPSAAERAKERARERELKAAVTTARRDLARKVLAEIRSVSTNQVNYEGTAISEDAIVKAKIYAAVERVFVECGVEVERSE